uniref:Reverse transcriptase domain-containing protein n=1 Tax=Tanacetum cinerariifolium TaxID=118510 RepID=A0A6L2MQA7_TANCI|nr:hypothetical protein [Tanacetum cinerariifolium]
MELWVELKRLYEQDDEDQLWTHTQNFMHASVEWKLYDTCGVYHVTSKDKEIFILVEKDCPLRKGRIVGNKMHKAFPLPVIEFPLAEEVPTPSEESRHCQKKREATAVKIALLSKTRRNFTLVLLGLVLYWIEGLVEVEKKSCPVDKGVRSDIEKVLKLKSFKKDALLKLFKLSTQERYEHASPKVTSAQDGKDYRMEKRDYAWLMISRSSRSYSSIQAQLKNLGREIKKVNEKVYAAQVGCKQCKGPHYTKDCALKEEGKTLEEAYYIQFGFRSLPSSSETNPRDQVKSISTTIEADSCSIHRIGSTQYAVSTGQKRTLMYETRQKMILFLSRLNGYYFKEMKGSYGPKVSEAFSKASQSIPQKEKDPGSFTLPYFINNVCFDNALVDLGASISVMPLLTYLNLGLGELAHTKLTIKLVDGTVKYPKGIAENMLVRIVKLRRNQGDDLMPTIEEGEIIKEFRTRDDKLDDGIDDYPSYCDYDKKIHIDCAHN